MTTVLIKRDVKVEFEDIGEGHQGDYNPKDPNDVELLRFSVYRRTCQGATWVEVDDASYCTQVPVKTTKKRQKELLRVIMDLVYLSVKNRASIKRVCEAMSWLEA